MRKHLNSLESIQIQREKNRLRSERRRKAARARRLRLVKDELKATAALDSLTFNLVNQKGE